MINGLVDFLFIDFTYCQARFGLYCSFRKSARSQTGKFRKEHFVSVDHARNEQIETDTTAEENEIRIDSFDSTMSILKFHVMGFSTGLAARQKCYQYSNSVN